MNNNPTLHPQPLIRNLRSAILAGGQSARMGSNKALLRLRPGGPTLLETVIERLLEAGFTDPTLVTNTPKDYTPLGLNIIPDISPGLGPLGGVMAALSSAQGAPVLIVACDMPFLNPSLLRYMASLPADYTALAPGWTSPLGSLRLEPLHAVYTPGCIHVIERRAAEGRLKLGDLLDALNATYIPEEVVRQHDPAMRSFYNVNTPEDWARLQADILI